MREFASIYPDISDAVAVVDEAWKFLAVNRAAEVLWGSTASKMIGQSIFAFPEFGLGAVFEEACRSSKQGEVPIAFTAPSERLGAWLEVRSYPLSAGYGLMLRDISETRDTHLTMLDRDRDLHVLQSINQRVFEISQDLILVVDRVGKLARVSPSSFAILGYRPEEMLGQDAAAYICPEDLERCQGEMRMARSGRLIRHFYCRYVHKDGRMVTLAWMGVWVDLEEQHFFTGRDMTEQIAAEERLRASQRMEAIGLLTGGMAHDFNNLLTVIIGNLDVLREKFVGDAEAEGFADMAVEASLRGAELTHQLLAFARRQTLDTLVFDINERVTATMDLLRRTLGEEIEIETALAADLWPALADPAQFESALVNLSINARDAMPNGGRLCIETANRQIDEIDAEDDPDFVPGIYVMLIVTDTGTGMLPEVLARVFDPFFTTKPVGVGTGLGLSMVYGFARQSQGHVRIYSEPGQGTTVRLYLPRASSGAAPEPVLPAPAAAQARGGETVLVVEDNPQVRKVAIAQLGRLGYRVLEADGSPAALAILQAGDAIDLLFTDVVMPGGMNGAELARAARLLRPGLKVLLTSGFAGSAAQSGTNAEEFRNRLSKPYRQAELAARVRGVLDS